jgi:hypothetical protein
LGSQQTTNPGMATDEITQCAVGIPTETFCFAQPTGLLQFHANRE